MNLTTLLTELLIENSLYSDEEKKFLQTVKERVPEKYTRYLSMIKNKGLDAAIEDFKQIDPFELKKKEKAAKSAQIKAKGDEKKAYLNNFKIGKPELSKLVEEYILNGELRKRFQSYGLPQLVASTGDLKVRKNQRDFTIEFVIENKKRYGKGEQGIIQFLHNLEKDSDDDILDDILKHKREKKWDDKWKRMGDEESDNDFIYEGHPLFSSRCSIWIRIMKTPSYFNIDMSASYKGKLTLDFEDINIMSADVDKDVKLEQVVDKENGNIDGESFKDEIKELLLDLRNKLLTSKPHIE